MIPELLSSLAKELKGKNYDLEGVNSHSSKQTHRTNMNWKTDMTSTRSVTTKKFAMDFSQNKKDLNAEQKKTALLKQRLREIESILAAGVIPKPLFFKHPPSSTKAKSVNITVGSEGGGRAQGTVGDGRPHSILDGDGQVQGSVDAQSIVRDGRLPEKTLHTHQGANLAQKFDSQLNLPTIPNDISAKMSRVTKDDVGRWH